MKSDLAKYGVIKQKSLTTTLPLLKEELMPHLFHGLLDGDGTIYFHSQSKEVTLRFLGSHYLVAQICMYFNIKYALDVYPSKKEDISYTELYNEKAKILIPKIWSHLDQKVCIQRKLKRAQNYIL